MGSQVPEALHDTGKLRHPLPREWDVTYGDRTDHRPRSRYVVPVLCG